MKINYSQTPSGMDHFIFVAGGGGGGGVGNYQKNSCTAKVEEKNHAQWAKGKKIEQAFLLIGSC